MAPRKLSSSFHLLFITSIISHASPFFTSDDPSAQDSQPQISNSDPHTHTDPREIRAVYDIMLATGNSWVSSIPDVCKSRWHGIECIQDHAHVLHVVSLSFGALSEDTAFPTCDPHSFLSPSIANLPHLKRLFFYRCCLHNPRPIPPEIGRLGATLQSLVLRENGHVGSLPPELANLTSLHTLDLHGNSLSSSIPPDLSNLSGLLLLDLSKNHLQGHIPATLGRLKSLNVLDLSRNFLQGPIAFEVGALSHLKKLDISHNQLSGLIPRSLGQLENLLLLDLSNNGFSGGIPATFGMLSNLQMLILQNTQMGAVIPHSLGILLNLQVLVLSYSQLVGPIPESFGRLSKLRVLHLDGNRLTGPIPESLGRLDQISEFNINNNRLSGAVPFSREFVWRLGRRLRVSNNTDLCYGFLRQTYDDALPSEQRADESILGIGVCTLNPAVSTAAPFVSPSDPSTRQREASSRICCATVWDSGSNNRPAILVYLCMCIAVCIFHFS